MTLEYISQRVVITRLLIIIYFKMIDMGYELKIQLSMRLLKILVIIIQMVVLSENRRVVRSITIH